MSRRKGLHARILGGYALDLVIARLSLVDIQNISEVRPLQKVYRWTSPEKKMESRSRTVKGRIKGKTETLEVPCGKTKIC